MSSRRKRGSSRRKRGSSRRKRGSSRRKRGAGSRHGPWIAIAGTRPNFVKLAPLVRAAEAAGRRLDWIDTGQHTAAALSVSMARDLGLPPALVRLRAPRAGAGRVSKLSVLLENHLARLDPALVVALGDVDSTLAGALAAWRLDQPLVHVEAGLRSFEPGMPEERNRVLVDGLSDRLYLSESQAEANLRAEGVALSRIRKPGNVMADALLQARGLIAEQAEAEPPRHPAAGYIVVTLHRQANVDDAKRLAAYTRALRAMAGGMPVCFLIHPRTRRRLRSAGLLPGLKEAGVDVLQPLAYLGFLALVSSAALVVTDSGGLQVEAALLDVPCLTLRRRTEHLLTLSHGGNRLVGGDPRRLPGIVRAVLEAPPARQRRPRAWDGRAAERIVADWVRGFDRPSRRPAASQAILKAL